MGKGGDGWELGLVGWAWEKRRRGAGGDGAGGDGAGVKELNLCVFNKGGYLRLAPIF